MQSRRSKGIWLRTPLAAVGFALAAASIGWCQQFLFFGTPDFELTAPQMETISSATQSRLEQVRALVAERRWAEAVDALREIATAEPGRVVEVNEGTFVNLPRYCQMQLAAMPAEGLAEYRTRVDPLAEASFRKGLASRDEDQLSAVVDEMFCSSWGDDALAALGELALEQGDYAAARRAWQAISPQLRDPQGRAPWFALHDVDLAGKWPELQSRWPTRAAPALSSLAYPDTDLNLADIRARLILTSIREGDLARAALELEVFRRMHPDAEGRLGGTSGPYVAALESLLASARDWPAQRREADWPTFAGAAKRNGVARPLGELANHAWAEPIKLTAAPRPDQGLGARLVIKSPNVTLTPIRESQRPAAIHPVVVDGRIFYSDGHQVFAVALATGKPAFGKNSAVYTGDQAADSHDRNLPGGASVGLPRYTLTVVNETLYARIGDDSTNRLRPERTRSNERIVGIDLRRDGLLTFQVKPDDNTWSFDGVPIGDGERLYMAMRHSDVKPGEYVACYDAATGRRLWRTALGAADTPAAGRGDETTHNLLTLAGDRIYANSNLGFVAALDAKSGELVWLRRYDRATGRHTPPGPVHFDRDLSPCVYDRGLVYVAPADSPQVFALDADTGATVWATDRLATAIHLLGVVDGTLIASGHQLWALDARSGRVRYVWPESEHAGIRGFGRGVIAGEEMFWPTRDKIYVFDVASGKQSREPIELGPLAGAGANLIAVDGMLVVVTPDRMVVLGPNPAPKPKQQTAEIPDTIAMHRPFLQ